MDVEDAVRGPAAVGCLYPVQADLAPSSSRRGNVLGEALEVPVVQLDAVHAALAAGRPAPVDPAALSPLPGAVLVDWLGLELGRTALDAKNISISIWVVSMERGKVGGQGARGRGALVTMRKIDASGCSRVDGTGQPICHAKIGTCMHYFLNSKYALCGRDVHRPVGLSIDGADGSRPSGRHCLRPGTSLTPHPTKMLLSK